LVFTRKVFEQIELPTTFLWNTLLRGLAQSDAPKGAIIFYKKAHKRVRSQTTWHFLSSQKPMQKLMLTRKVNRCTTML